jgi:hypothetical protein
VETEEDFDEDADEESRQKQFKTRKWWVNRMLGRELKLELAEDDQSRYKKRFGKGGSNNNASEDARPPRANNFRQNRGGRDQRPARDEAAPQEPAPLKEATDLQAARLMGVVVKHTGTKMTFD